MFTTQSRDVLIDLGARFSWSLLDVQAGYTLPLARGDAAVAKKAGAVLDEVEAARASVRAAMGDREVAAADGVSATGAVAGVLRDAKVWLRTLKSNAGMAAIAGASFPADLARMGVDGKGAAEVLDVLGARVALARAHQAALAAYGVDQAFLEAGDEVVTRLQGVVGAQNQKRHDALPDKVREFYAEKGLLYLGLKMINEAGHAVYAGDLPKAARYNLGLLYAKRAKAGGQPTPPVNP
jgi:hypothetical protein